MGGNQRGNTFLQKITSNPDDIVFREFLCPDNPDKIFAISSHNSSELWLGTQNKLYRVNLKTGRQKAVNYSGKDASPVIYNLKWQNDNLWIGTGAGLFEYVTRSHKTLKTLQPVSKLFIDKVLVTNAKNNSLETLHPANGQLISLHRNQLPITVNVSDINLRYCKTQIFNYRLLPDNTRWNTLTNSRSIQLLNLSPGNYSLEIKTAAKGKVNNKENILHVPITVIPYWWQSKPAYFAYLLIIVLIIYLIFRFSLKRKMEHQENLRLKEVNHLKSQLYTNITHEFRTPLTVIQVVNSDISNSLSKEEQVRFADKFTMIERNSNKLLHLVKQMLDMSKLEEGKMKLDLIQDDIVSFLQYVLESFQSMADAKKIKLEFYRETDKVVMDYDQDKIFMVATNLLSNAIKFTPKGGKVIFHVKHEKSANGDRLMMKVQDSGIGIQNNNLPRIFDRFYQIDNSLTRKGEGTGIGLALTKEMVELMNGVINVKSTLGEQTEFTVALPVTGKAPMHKAKKPGSRLFKKHPLELDKETTIGSNDLPLALVVEDNPDVAKYIVSCLAGKYRVKLAPDGKQGVDVAVKTIPDIIISDVMMPEKDGFEVCEALKTDERTSHIPIVLLTAKATVNDRIEGLSHGADAYLTKPFNKKELFVRLEQLIKIRKQLQEKYRKVELSITEKSEPEGEERFLKKVIGLIEQQLDNSEFDPAMLASALNMSESQLYRKLKAVSGKSIAVYIRSIRLLSAKKMLETSDKNISEVAFLCGFNNPSWFSRIFKKEFGVSPGTIRK